MRAHDFDVRDTRERTPGDPMKLQDAMASMFGFDFASIKAGQASQEAYVIDGVQKCHYHEIGQAYFVLNDENMKDPHCGLPRSYQAAPARPERRGLSLLIYYPTARWKTHIQSAALAGLTFMAIKGRSRMSHHPSPGNAHSPPCSLSSRPCFLDPRTLPRTWHTQIWYPL